MDFVACSRMFVRVVESGSFSAVATENETTQPTVSKHVSALETHLGAKLFNRSTRKLSLTEAGSEFYDRCKRILSDIEEAESSIGHRTSTPGGLLKVHMPITFGRMHILPRLWAFMQAFPDIHLDIRMDDHYANLIEEGVDVAIRIGPLSDSNMIARKIGTCPRATIASPSYLQKHGTPANIQELTQHNCVVYSLLTTGNEWHFNSNKGHESIRVTGNFIANSPDAIREAIVAGVGIAVTPLWLIDDCLQRGEVVTLLNNYNPTPLEIHAIYPERKYVPEKVRCFIDHLRDCLNN